MTGVLGATVLDRALGRLGTETALGSSTLVCVYVSASWCGPCREFTPKLGAWFAKDAATRGAAVVFASLDRDEASFSAYFAKMPWTLALPPSDGEAFASRFGVRSVPTLLVFARATGALLTTKGVEGLLNCAEFPFVWGAARLGRHVTLRGLVSRADLNGADGVVVSATQATERFAVRVGDGGEVIAVKADALGPHWADGVVGRKGTLLGLASSPALNGAAAAVIGFDVARGRLSVKAGGATVSVRRECFTAT